MLKPEQITELCICNRQDLITPLEIHGSKVMNKEQGSTPDSKNYDWGYSIYRSTHGVGSISEQDFIDNCIKVSIYKTPKNA